MSVWRRIRSPWLLRLLSMAVTAGTSISSRGLFAVQAVLLARILGPEARGEYATAITYPSLLAFLGLLGANYAIARRAAREGRHRPQLQRAAWRLGAITGLASAVLAAILGILLLPPDKAYLAGLCVLSSLILPFEQMRTALGAVDQGSGRLTPYNLGELIAFAVMPVLLMVAWMGGVTQVWLIVVTAIFASAVGLAVRWRLSQCPRGLTPAVPDIRTLLREGRPYAFSQAVADVYGRLDALTILWLASFYNQGLYAAAIATAGVLTAAPSGLAIFAFNAGVADEGRHRKTRLLGLGAAAVLFQVLSVAILASCLGPLMALVFGDRFAAAVPIAMALLPATALQGVAILLDGYLRGGGITGFGIIARICGAATMIVLALMFWGSWGMMAVPLGAAVGHGTSALVLLGGALCGSCQKAENLQDLSGVEP